MSQFNITGTGFNPGETITFAWDSPATTLASATVAGDGTVGPVQASVPAGSATGAHTISAKRGAVVIDTVAFTVDAPPAPTLAATPTHGLAGSSVALSGANWPASTSIQIVFDNPTVVIATIMTDGSGAFSGQAATIPSGASVGAHSMSGRVGSSGSPLANALYNVDSPTTAALSVSPNNGPVGAQTTYHGSNYNPNAFVDIYSNIDGGFHVSATADSSGAFTFTARTPTVVGANTLTGTDNGGTPRAANCVYTVTAVPTITVAPTSGAGGSSISFNLSGFTPNSHVTIRSNLNNGWSVGVTVDGSGAFTGAASTAPPSPNGAHTLTATDNGSPQKSASCTFTVSGAASLSVSPTSGPTNTPAAFTGNGFTPGSVVNITDDMSSQSLGLQADSSGHFVTSAIQTPPPPGVHHHTATDNGSPPRSAACDFTNTSSGVSLVVSPASGPGGQNIAFSGSGYTPSSVVTVHDSMDGGFGPQFAVDGSGSFGPTFTPAPAGPPGAHVMTGTDSGSPQRSAQTTFQKTASSAASLVVAPSSQYPEYGIATSGSNWPPNDHVNVAFSTAAEGSGSGDTDSSGSWRSGGIIPKSTTPGSHQLGARNNANTVQAQAPVTVKTPNANPLGAQNGCVPQVGPSSIQWGMANLSGGAIDDGTAAALLSDVIDWLNAQVAPPWGRPTSAYGGQFASEDAIPAGMWRFVFIGDNGGTGLGGVHGATGDNQRGVAIPTAYIYTSGSGHTFTLPELERIASHEAAEQIVDPLDTACGQDWAAANGAYSNGANVCHAVEVGDPVEFNTMSYGGRNFTDFCLPAYWIAGSAGPWDSFGLLSGPFTANGGHTVGPYPCPNVY